MGSYSRWATAVAAGALLIAAAVPASAEHATRPSSNNMHALGHSEHEAQFLGVPSADRHVNSDLAFWGDLAFNGNYDGFRIVDISAPGNPKELVHQRCNGDQGDLVVWDNIVVRTWNSPAPAGRFCDGQPVPEGFEGVHVFDISDITDPQLVAAVELECGSHTATGIPDLVNNRLVVYSNVSSGCDWMDILEVPLGAPENAALLRTEPLVGGSLGSNMGCHDVGVILGDVNLAACASGHAANVFDIGANSTPGGSLDDPQFLYTIEEQDGMGNKVGIGGRWHSAAFTWDGEVLVLGWEPGGGGSPECEASDADLKKSLFFYDAATGAKLGQWVLPRAQTADENCTVHNFNVVPLRSGRYVAVSGNYQAGTWVTDFTDPANAETIAFSDPPPLMPRNLGGAWSTYWYNHFLYESEIQSGLNVFRVSDKVLGGAIKLPHLNPQTQEFSLP